MEERQPPPYSIYSTRDDQEMFSAVKHSKCRVRTARFLNPSAKTLDQAFPIPRNTPLLSEIFSHHLQQWPSKVVFKGWKSPQPKWKQWVLQISPKYSPIWKKSGIHDAIMASVYDIRPYPELVLGLSEFWCPVTNTFVFSWGEATITLEDIMVLGGYPVLGKPVTSSIYGVEKMVQEMEKHRIDFSRTAAHKASHGGWLNQYMGKQSDFEHLAFLSLWLSRYVFTSLPEKVIGKHVFPIAAHLARGTPMALAPAVLASLYKDLSLLRKQTISCSDSITVAAPFQLVLLWAFDRFPHLGPRNPNVLEWNGEPRAAQWHKLSSKSSSLPIVRSSLGDEENFRWRPYCAYLKNWRPPYIYREVEQTFLDFSGLGRDLISFAKCLQGGKVVGLGFREVYLPHRVGRQFGFDQDIPAALDFGFHVNLRHVKFFVPSRSSVTGVSERYLRWWKNSMIVRKDAIKNSLELEFFRKFSRQISKGDCHKFLMPRNVHNPKPVPRVPAKLEVEEDDYALSGGHPSPCKNNSQENREWRDKYDDIPHAVFRETGISLSRSVARAPVANSVIIRHKRPLPTEWRSSIVHFHDQKGQSSGSIATSRILPSTCAERWTSHARSSSAINTSCEYVRKREHTVTSDTNVQHKSTINAVAISRIDKEVEKKGGHSSSETNAAGNTSVLYDPLDFVSLSKRIKLGKGSGESAKDTGEKKEHSLHNPVKGNCVKQANSSRNEKLGLLQRMERAEKIIGLKSN